jgi:DNA (cytosine-5)-methyltransferase 1
VRVQVEKNQWCHQTLWANRRFFKSKRLTQLQADVRDVDARHIFEAGGLRPGDIALLAAGPPCQSFSHAGLRGGLEDPRGSLVAEFLRLLRSLKPDGFIFENVAGFADLRIGPHGSRYLLGWFLQQCMRAGYALTWGVVDAADYGVPQHRVRFLTLGCKRGCAPTFPNPSAGPRVGVDYLNLRDALSHLSQEDTWADGSERFSEMKARIMCLVPPGGDWRDLPEDAMVEAMGGALESRGGKTGWWRRLAWDEPAPTIVGRPTHRATCLCHPGETRPLTVREAATLQAFPAEWSFQGPLAPKYRQVGDAVPPRLASAMAEAMIRHQAGAAHSTITGAPLAAWPRPSNVSGRRKLGIWGWSHGSSVVLHGPEPETYESPRPEILELSGIVS